MRRTSTAVRLCMKLLLSDNENFFIQVVKGAELNVRYRSFFLFRYLKHRVHSSCMDVISLHGEGYTINWLYSYIFEFKA